MAADAAAWSASFAAFVRSNETPRSGSVVDFHASPLYPAYALLKEARDAALQAASPAAAVSSHAAPPASRCRASGTCAAGQLSLGDCAICLLELAISHGEAGLPCSASSRGSGPAAVSAATVSLQDDDDDDEEQDVVVGGRRAARPAASSGVIPSALYSRPAFVSGCRHIFHWECIVRWMGAASTCPVCKAEVGTIACLSLVPTPGGGPPASPTSPQSYAAGGGGGLPSLGRLSGGSASSHVLSRLPSSQPPSPLAALPALGASEGSSSSSLGGLTAAPPLTSPQRRAAARPVLTSAAPPPPPPPSRCLVRVEHEVSVPPRAQAWAPTDADIQAFGYVAEELEAACMVCRRGDREELLLLCDQRCGNAAHTECVGLGTRIPEGDWYCAPCRRAGGGRGSSGGSGRHGHGVIVLDSEDDEDEESGAASRRLARSSSGSGRERWGGAGGLDAALSPRRSGTARTRGAAVTDIAVQRLRTDVRSRHFGGDGGGDGAEADKGPVLGPRNAYNWIQKLPKTTDAEEAGGGSSSQTQERLVKRPRLGEPGAPPASGHSSIASTASSNISSSNSRGQQLVTTATLLSTIKDAPPSRSLFGSTSAADISKLQAKVAAASAPTQGGGAALSLAAAASNSARAASLAATVGSARSASTNAATIAALASASSSRAAVVTPPSAPWSTATTPALPRPQPPPPPPPPPPPQPEIQVVSGYFNSRPQSQAAPKAAPTPTLISNASLLTIPRKAGAVPTAQPAAGSSGSGSALPAPAPAASASAQALSAVAEASLVTACTAVAREEARVRGVAASEVAAIAQRAAASVLDAVRSGSFFSPPLGPDGALSARASASVKSRVFEEVRRLKERT